jgi:hypothetical protein
LVQPKGNFFVKLTPRRATSAVALLSLINFCSAANAAESEGWNWLVAPYLWAVSVGTDIDTDRIASSGEAEFADIIDKLDGAFQVRLEGRGDHVGLLADITWFALGDESDRPRSHTEADLDMWLIEAAGTWSPGDKRDRGLDLIAGLRYIDVDLSVQVDPVAPILPNFTIGADQSYSDLMVGARYTFALSDRWALTLRADGSAGDTEGTWNASAVVQYRTNNGGWLLAYRHLLVEIEAGSSNTEITMSGPAIGYGFAF